LLEGLTCAVEAGGVELRTRAQVRHLEVSDAQVRGVVLESGELVRADWTVLAAGGWAGALASAAGSPVALQTTRRHLLLTRPDRRIADHWPVVWDETAGFYARPEAGGLLLCACDQSEVQPDECTLDPAEEAAITRAADACLLGLEGLQRERFWAGMRTFGPDALPLVGRDPSLEGLFWNAGLGGHGMTTSLAIGRVAAEGLLDRVSDAQVARALSPERLAPSAARAGG
jgi:glycine/D-amino acid oxidase-like deaminating enzyme